MRQIVIDITAPAVDSQFGNLMLAEKYLHLSRERWCAGFFRTDSKPEPCLLVRADGAVEHLRSGPLRLAFSFHRQAAGGLFGVYVGADSAALRAASPSGHPVIEALSGLDDPDSQRRHRDALARDVLHLCMADRSSWSQEVIGPDGRSEEMTPPRCVFDRVERWDAACRAAVQREFAELLAYHAGLPSSRRDYRASVRQLMADFPPSSSPLLEAGSVRAAAPARAPEPVAAALARPWWRFW